MRLATKLSVGLMAGLLVALEVDGYVEIRRQIEVYDAGLQADLRSQAKTLAGAVGKLWSSFGDAGAAEVLQAANDRGLGMRARWISLRRVTEPGAGPAPTADELEQLKIGRAVVRMVGEEGKPSDIFAWSPVHVDSGMMGVVELAKPAVDEDRFIKERLARTVMTIVILAVVAWLLAMMLGARLVGRPVEALIAKARRAGEGRFDEPLLLSGQDELSDLAVALNAMCLQLEDDRQRIAEESHARLAAMKQVRRADRLTTVGRLAAGIAHELGTPLNVVKERVKMAAAGEVPPDEAPRNTSIIVGELDRINRIIRQLLDFSRPHEPVKERCDLPQLVEQTVQLVTPLAEKARVTLEVDTRGHDLVAEVDARQIQQVLTNLVMNGLQAMPQGGPLRIGVARERLQELPAGGEHADLGAEYCRLWVEDHGSGIRDADLPHIFEPFFTTKEIGEGTGLGLSVAHGIVEEHRGFITVDTRVGQGTRFSVYLPVGGAS